jgi:hypothetical protein
MATNIATIQPYRKIKPVLHKEPPASPAEGSGATIINISEKIDSNAYAGRQNISVTEVSSLNMPPLVRAYFRGRDNDPL